MVAGGIRIRAALEGLEPYRSTLHEMAAGARDLRPVWDEIFADYVESAQRLFASNGASGFKKWPRLSRRYAAMKEKRYPGKPMLVAIGRLREAALGGPGSRVTVTPTKAEFVITYPIANVHNKRRPPIQITRAQRLRWYRILLGYIKRLDDQAQRRADRERAA